jgi:hypothetical protein
MGLFKNRQETQAVSARQAMEMKYASARRDILLVLGFTIINIILLVTNTNTYFLFSAYIPYLIADFAMYFCGKYPAEYYEGVALDFYGDTVFAVMLALAALILVMYLLSWFFSDKGRVGWLIFAAVLFGLDTAGMLLMGVSLEYVLDILFHAWFLYSLIGGIVAYYKLKKLPPEEEAAPVLEETEPVATTEE